MRGGILLLGLILAGAVGGQARALPFFAGDLIVTTENEMIELDGLSSEIVDRLDLVGAIGPNFLPNGNLLVIGSGPSNNLLEITPDGDVVRQIDVDISDVAITDVLVGPTGAIYVRFESGLARIDLDTGEVLSDIELAGLVNPCFLPNGNLLVPVSGAPAVLREVDADTGDVLREVEIAGISTITGATPGPVGRLLLTTPDEVVSVDPLSGVIVDRIDLVGGYNPCFLPNGLLLAIVDPGSAFQAVAPTSGALQVIDFASGEVVATLVSSGVTGFTGVPFRFKASVKGRLASSDELSTINQAGELALGPGMGRITLQADPSGDLAALFGIETLVLFGSEAPGAATRRLYWGSQVASAEFGPQASMGLHVVGRSGDPLQPASAGGSLQIASGEGIFVGQVTTSKLLNR